MKPRRLLFSAIGFGFGCLLQIIALARYISRLPDDWIGITIYIVTILAFGAAAIVTYIRWTQA